MSFVLYILPLELFQDKNNISVPCFGLNPNWFNVVCRQFSIRLPAYRIVSITLVNTFDKHNYYKSIVILLTCTFIFILDNRNNDQVSTDLGTYPWIRIAECHLSSLPSRHARPGTRAAGGQSLCCPCPVVADKRGHWQHIHGVHRW